MDVQLNLFEELTDEKGALEKLKGARGLYDLAVDEVAFYEGKLKEAKAKLETIQRDMIPEILNNAGLSKIVLDDGREVVVKDQVKASITEGNKDTAFKSMVAFAMADGFTEKVALEMVRSMFKEKLILESNSLSEQVLLNNGLAYDKDRNIHNQTLNKYCRDRLAQGKEIPEGVSLFTYQEAVIK